jgi:hypothetical protein
VAAEAVEAEAVEATELELPSTNKLFACWHVLTVSMLLHRSLGWFTHSTRAYLWPSFPFFPILSTPAVYLFL